VEPNGVQLRTVPVSGGTAYRRELGVLGADVAARITASRVARDLLVLVSAELRG